MQFMNQEIRNCCFQLKGCCCCNRSAAYMNLYAGVINIRHITDLLHFSQAACHTKVWLDNLKCILLQKIAETPAGRDTLTGSNRNIQLIVNLLHGLYIDRIGRLFQIIDSKLFQSLAKLYRSSHVGERMQFNDNIQLVTACLTHCLYTLIAHVQNFRR